MKLFALLAGVILAENLAKSAGKYNDTAGNQTVQTFFVLAS